MDISSFTSAASSASTQSVEKASSVISSDFETFLKMMTTQAKYQDPLEPIDSSEYAAQLAQFSMVEQQVKSNELLSGLAVQMGAGNMASMAGWIGMDALTTAPAYFDGAPVTVEPNPLAAADQMVLVVFDEAGQEVQRTSMAVSAEPIEWAGVQDDGTPFESGLYSFSIESRSNGELMDSTPIETYSRITEARIEAGSAVLVLEGGALITTAQVTGLREGA
ncbi:MAG: flagellar basal-body rod modification protein FlgD [Ascidiaceihabitans sp.]|jgi:flagellar basal-body rod modification protein FlgD